MIEKRPSLRGSKTRINKSDIKDIEAKEIALRKKADQLLKAKKRYQKIAGEYIDLWMQVKKAKRLKKQVDRK